MNFPIEPKVNELILEVAIFLKIFADNPMISFETGGQKIDFVHESRQLVTGGRQICRKAKWSRAADLINLLQ